MLAYDADLELFRDNFKRFMNEHVAPYYEEWEHEGMMPRSVWNAMGENGFLCVDVPEEYGGYGVPTHYSLMLIEESARAGYSAISTGLSCHSDIAAPYILHIGTEEQKKYWLPKMVSGEVVQFQLVCLVIRISQRRISCILVLKNRKNTGYRKWCLVKWSVRLA